MACHDSRRRLVTSSLAEMALGGVGGAVGGGVVWAIQAFQKYQDQRLKRVDHELKRQQMHQKGLERGTRASALKQAQELFTSNLTTTAQWSPRVVIDQVALTEALQAEFGSGATGALILCLPQGAGKSTSILEACTALTKDKKIDGVVTVDLARGRSLNHRAKVDVHELFWRAFGLAANEHNFTLHDLMQRSPDDIKTGVKPKRVVVVLDNADFPLNQDQVLELVGELMMSSSDPRWVGNDSFLPVATCQDRTTAQNLLGLNGGVKVRALGYGTRLLDGDPRRGKTSWVHRGVKWRCGDFERLLRALDEAVGAQGPFPDDARKRLLDLAEQAGTPGFLCDAHLHLTKNKLLRGEVLEMLTEIDQVALYAQAAETKWSEVAKIVEPAANKTAKGRRRGGGGKPQWSRRV